MAQDDVPAGWRDYLAAKRCDGRHVFNVDTHQCELCEGTSNENGNACYFDQCPAPSFIMKQLVLTGYSQDAQDDYKTRKFN